MIVLFPNHRKEEKFISFFVAFEICILLTIPALIALFKSHFFYMNTVVCVLICNVFLWASLFICFGRKYNISLGKKKVWLLILSFFIVALYFIRVIWFNGYLTLTPEATFLDGRSHNDTFYHVTLAESIKNYGFPATLFNKINFHKYHFLSHFIFAGISKVFRLPCYVTYNYLYPILFFPIFVFLLFQALSSIRNYFSIKGTDLSLDIVFSIFICIGFLPINYYNQIKIWWFSTYSSESYFISLIFVLLFFVVGEKINKQPYGRQINIFIAIPFFMLLITASKISTGIIFLIGICWVLLRTLKINKNLIFIICFFIIFLILCLCFFIRNSENNFLNMNIYLFDYIRTYVKLKQCFSHLFFILFPSITLFLLDKGDLSVKEYFLLKKAILPEVSLVISLCGIIPGLLLKIVGGSAAYFFLPALFVSLFFLWCSGCFQRQYKQASKSFQLLFFMFVFVIYAESYVHFLKPRFNINLLKKDFTNTEIVMDNPFYNTLLTVNKITEGRKKEYGVFLASDCEIFGLYPIKETKPDTKMKSLYAITANLDLPIINATYIRNGNEFRVGGYLLKWNVAPKDKDTMITLGNMSERAKELGIKHIIVLTKDDYNIIDVN